MVSAASLSKLIVFAIISLIIASATAQFDNPRERCRREMHESHELRSCKQYIMQKGRSMLMSFTNHEMRERCCMELQDISPGCRCYAIEEMMRCMQEEMEQERYRHGGDMSRRMIDMAERLPSMCRMRPGYCHMHERKIIY